MLNLASKLPKILAQAFRFPLFSFFKLNPMLYVLFQIKFIIIIFFRFIRCLQALLKMNKSI